MLPISTTTEHSTMLKFLNAILWTMTLLSRALWTARARCYLYTQTRHSALCGFSHSHPMFCVWFKCIKRISKTSSRDILREHYVWERQIAPESIKIFTERGFWAVCTPGSSIMFESLTDVRFSEFALYMHSHPLRCCTTEGSWEIACTSTSRRKLT